MGTHGLIITQEEFTAALPQLEDSRLHWQVWNAEDIFLGKDTNVEIEVPTNEFDDLKKILKKV